MARGRWFVRCAGAAVAAAAFVGAVATAGPSDDALAAFRKGDFAKAAELARKASEGTKDPERALYVLGEAELALEHWDAAEAAFRKILTTLPKNGCAMAGAGRALTGRGDIRGGAALLAESVQVDNRNTLGWCGQAENILAGGKETDLEAARINLDATLKLDAKDALVNRLMVEVLLRQGKVDDAARQAETYAKLDKDSAMSWFLRGLVLDRRGKPADAIAAYEKTLKKDELFLDAHRNLAVVLTTSNAGYADAAKVERACTHAKRYAELGGRDTELPKLVEQIRAVLAAGGAPK